MLVLMAQQARQVQLDQLDQLVLQDLLALQA
jgi:hypothetical protein